MSASNFFIEYRGYLYQLISPVSRIGGDPAVHEVPLVVNHSNVLADLIVAEKVSLCPHVDDILVNNLAPLKSCRFNWNHFDEGLIVLLGTHILYLWHMPFPLTRERMIWFRNYPVVYAHTRLYGLPFELVGDNISSGSEPIPYVSQSTVGQTGFDQPSVSQSTVGQSPLIVTNVRRVNVGLGTISAMLQSSTPLRPTDFLPPLMPSTNLPSTSTAVAPVSRIGPAPVRRDPSPLAPISAPRSNEGPRIRIASENRSVPAVIQPMLTDSHPVRGGRPRFRQRRAPIGRRINYYGDNWWKNFDIVNKPNK